MWKLFCAASCWDEVHTETAEQRAPTTYIIQDTLLEKLQPQINEELRKLLMSSPKQENLFPVCKGAFSKDRITTAIC